MLHEYKIKVLVQLIFTEHSKHRFGEWKNLQKPSSCLHMVWLICAAHLSAEGTAEQAAQVVGERLRLARLCRVDHGDLGPGGHCPSHE